MARRAEKEAETVPIVTVPTNPQSVPVRMLTAQELAVYLRVNRSTVYRLLKQGKLPGFRIGSEWRFQLEEVDRWFRDHTQRGN
jgi:excisionase family DNA binding protein